MSRRSTPPVAGRNVNPLSVVTVSFLLVFLAAIAILVLADLFYTDCETILGLFRSREVLAAMRLSAVTSVITLFLVVLFAVPMGYALSRYRFPGHTASDVLVDLPIVLPPVVVGVSLLVFFATWPGRWITHLGFNPHSVVGIVLCQFFVSASFAIRSVKAAFDSVDTKLENLALTLGCMRARAFRMVALAMKSGSKTILSVLLPFVWIAVVGLSVFLVLKRREEYGLWVYIVPAMAAFMRFIFTIALLPARWRTATSSQFLGNLSVGALILAALVVLGHAMVKGCHGLFGSIVLLLIFVVFVRIFIDFLKHCRSRKHQKKESCFPPAPALLRGAKHMTLQRFALWSILAVCHRSSDTNQDEVFGRHGLFVGKLPGEGDESQQSRSMWEMSTHSFLRRYRRK